MTKRALPRTPPKADVDTRMFLDAVKENIESLTGVRGGKIKELPATATNADIIGKINELVGRLQ